MSGQCWPILARSWSIPGSLFVEFGRIRVAFSGVAKTPSWSGRCSSSPKVLTATRGSQVLPELTEICTAPGECCTLSDNCPSACYTMSELACSPRVLDRDVWRAAFVRLVCTGVAGDLTVGLSFCAGVAGDVRRYLMMADETWSERGRACFSRFDLYTTSRSGTPATRPVYFWDPLGPPHGGLRKPRYGQKRMSDSHTRVLLTVFGVAHGRQSSQACRSRKICRFISGTRGGLREPIC